MLIFSQLFDLLKYVCLCSCQEMLFNVLESDFAFYYGLLSSNEIMIPNPNATLHPLHQAAGASIIRDPDCAAPRGGWQRKVRARTQRYGNSM